MSKLGYYVDVLLYAAIAGLTVAVGWKEELDWKFYASVSLSVLVAIKAKRSPGTLEKDK